MLIPDPLKVGYFYHFVDDLISDDIIEKQICTDLSVFYKYCTQISINEYEKIIKDISVPSWILDDNNFIKLLNGDFNALMPMTAEVIPSLNCPFRCNQCSYRPQKTALGLWDNKDINIHKANMSIEIMKTALEKLYNAGTRNIVFTGGGEPLTNSIVTLNGIKIAKDKGFVTCLYTNGLLMSNNIINAILESPPDYIRISIYGFTQEDFSLYTNAPSKNYQLVFDNIKKLVKARKNSKQNFIISLSFLLHPDMKSLIDGHPILDLLAMLRKTVGEDVIKNLSTIRFTPAVDYYQNQQHLVSFFDKCFKDSENIIQEFLDYGVIVRPYYHRLNDLYKTKNYSECRACGLYAEIGPDGSMYQCCEKLLLDKYKIGNIIENDILNVYLSQQRLNLLKEINENIRFCPSLCKPHETNKSLSYIPEVISESDKERILYWRKKLLMLKKEDNIPFDKFNPFES